MSNKEKNKKAFSVLETSTEFSLEEKQMTIIRKKVVARTILTAAAVLLFIIIVGGGTAYATNVGDIQRKFDMWFRGKQGSAVINYDGEGGVSVDYVDEYGNTHPLQGWTDPDHPEPLTPEEEEEAISEAYNEVRVDFSPYGRVTLFYQDQIIDISDKFIDGICDIYVRGKPYGWYVTVELEAETWGCCGDRVYWEVADDSELKYVEHRPFPAYSEEDMETASIRLGDNGKMMVLPVTLEADGTATFGKEEKSMKLADDAFFYYFDDGATSGETITKEGFIAYMRTQHYVDCSYHLNKKGEIDYIKGAYKP